MRILPLCVILDSMEQSHQFEQTDAIRDHVFPVFTSQAEIAPQPDTFAGTGFFVGNRNHAITAAHVIRGSSAAIIRMAGPAHWLSFSVLNYEVHPREDLAVITIQPPSPTGHWSSIFTLRKRDTRSSLPYQLWGYPEDAAIELLESHGYTRPDLVFSAGHVRRRISDVPLPAIRGSKFIELSAVAGAGCSGSPITGRGSIDRLWDLLGVYVGERVNDRATSVGYGTVLDELGDWAPNLLGRTIAEEANDNQYGLP